MIDQRAQPAASQARPDPAPPEAEKLLHAVRAHLRRYPNIGREARLLGERGALFFLIRQHRAFRCEGHGSFRAFCDALHEEFPAGCYSRACLVIHIYLGFTPADLQHSRATAAVLAVLLAAPRPMRGQLLAQADFLRAPAARALLARALRTTPPR